MKGTTCALFTVVTPHQMCYEIIGDDNQADHIHNRVDHIHNRVNHIYNRGNHMLAQLSIYGQKWQVKHESNNNKSGEKLVHKHTDTRTAQFVNLSIDLGMYPWQTFRNSPTSVEEEKRDRFLRDEDKVFFLEGSQGSREVIGSNCSVVLHSWASACVPAGDRCMVQAGCPV